MANALVSFACAMQVQTFRKVRGHAYASTMCIMRRQHHDREVHRLVKMTVPNSALPVFTAKTARVKHKAVFRAIRNVFSAKQLPEGIFWLRSFSRQMGIFQLARKVSAMVGSRAPKPSAASAGYRHETA